ncbi:MAG: hypothetical protein ACKV2T_35695 [Kofleriaceae bacterium]
MDVTAANRVGHAYAVRVEKLAQNTMKAQGEGAVALIEGAKPPPPGPNGEGSRINTYA